MSSEPMKGVSEAGSALVYDRIEVRGPDGVVTCVDLSSTRLVIGRASDCQVRLADEAVSRHHADLFCDPFGRWWIHDLRSRNGTKVNGLPVVERVIGVRDAVEIRPFGLRLLQSAPAVEVAEAAAGTPLPVSDDEFDRITTETEMEVARLAASHISKLVRFGRQLLDTEATEERLHLLCSLMVTPELRGRMAVAMRLRKDRPEEPPRMLCEPATPPGLVHTAPYLSKGMLRAVCQRNEPVLGSNVRRGGAQVELTVSRQEMAMSALACPFRSDEGTIDCLYVVLPPELGTNEWLALASLATEEYQKAELAWAARRQGETNVAIERELEQAREIQMKLIPRQLDIAGLDVAIGFEPCRWVGGDYVDVVQHPDGRVLLAIADVCGKGLHAAMVATSVHSMVHAGMRVGLDLGGLMGHLNEHLCAYLPEHSFVTMMAAMLDPKTGETQVVNSGHPPALVIDARGGLRWLQSGANFPLGVSPVAFECQDARIGGNEMLAMFSDGLTEADSRRIDNVGLEPLAQRLSAFYGRKGQQHAAAVAENLSAYSKELHDRGLASDDRTFLLARRK